MQAWISHGAQSRKGCPEVAKRKSFDPSVQVRVLKTLDISYSHSFTLVCRGAIPIGSSLVVGFIHLAAESSACPRVGVWDKPWDKFANYFETAGSQFHFCPGDKNGLVLRP